MVNDDYVRVGDGTHVVLVLPGWFGTANAWETLVSHLDAEHFTYVFSNYRGYGGRRSVRGDYTIEEAAGDTLALADELGADRFSLVGHSMGGSVMQWVYADAPERVRALVGLSPVPAGGVPFDDETWELFSSAVDDPAARRAIKVLAGEHDPALGERTMLQTFAQWYPKLELEVLPGAGHYPADEVPVTVAASIELFLDEH